MLFITLLFKTENNIFIVRFILRLINTNGVSIGLMEMIV